jgi:hypothetical protein
MACGCTATGTGVEQKHNMPVSVADNHVIVNRCDVCAILDGDNTPKITRYCGVCDKFICATCWKSPYRRGLAAFSFRLNQLLKR